MNIKNGDIVTLENGDTAKVLLEIITKKVYKLEVSHRYRLRRNGQFCHSVPENILEKRGEEENWIFVGKFSPYGTPRYIFYGSSERGYIMFGDSNLDYVISEVI